ncbi:MAG: Ig-like domain-containing protein [Prevotella sp.]|nr:Ig-like domain-containing protein [Prevotella sp.]
MKQKLFSMFLAVLGLVVGTSMGLAQEAFADFAVQLTAAPFSDNTSTTSFNVKVDSSTGAASIVEAGEESTFSFTSARWNDGQHGWVNCVFTIPVNGPVKIGLGNCRFGDQTGTIVDSDNNSTTLTVGNSNCWSSNDIANTTSYTVYKGTSATTLTVTYNGYCPYISVEAVDASELVSDATVSFSAGEATGMIVPASITGEVGSEITLPKNFTMYVEGKTLTGWSDGTTSYAPGASYTVPSADITLDPVFTENTVSLADRTEPVTLKWDFQRKNGAPTISSQNGTGLWVTQAIIGNETIDVKLDFDTNNGGKLANGNWTDWCQMNGGTTLTIPNYKGATVSIEAYSAPTTTTIDGQTDYTANGNTISYTVANTAETIDIVIGDGTYYRYVQTVLPVVQQSGGTTYTDEEVTVTWAMTSQSEPNANTVAPEGVVSIVSFDTGTSSIVGTGNITNLSGTNVKTGIKVQAASSANDLISWNVKPAAGLTFTPVKVSGYINRAGTDVENGIKIYASKEGEDKLLLGTYTAWRSGKSSSTKAYDASAVYMYEITLTSEQQSALTSADGFKLYSTVGAYNETNPKQGIFGEVTITGTVSGTVADVETFTLAAAANIADGGTVTKYPNADEYDEGTEVTLTATKNFGYNFVNWTDADDNVVSTEAKFKYTVDAAAELTANFEQINTYELKIAVDGTNDYMVKINPAPTVVDGKWMYEEGTTVELTADQYDGLVTFTNWSDGTTNSTKSVSMTEDVEVTANYAETDIIAGWDFYKKGSDGRVADFHSADNESAALTLVNTETNATSGWLDKSTLAAGGYESFKGAATNWRTGSQDGDVGNWHWQTKVNAEAFQNINVQFQMMYNYNAYQTYLAEYSLDGETWVNFGSITMTGAKTAASFSESLPAECNNQSNVYIRMRADKENSEVAGAASAYDGNTLAMFFITGTEQLQNDGVAPVVVTTVPAKGATGASATGKIVLTFDEKVKVADEATASLNGVALTPSVSGKTITFAYKGLDYSTAYTFTLPANTVADLTDNYIDQPVTINFTTMTRPAVSKQMYDAVVSNVDELLAAITAAQSRSDKNTRYRVFVKNGEYTIPLYSTLKTCNGYDVPECITFINTQNLSLVGESRDGVIITNGIPADATFTGQYGLTSKYDGIGNSDVFQISGSDYYFQDLTIETGMQDATGRDLAVHDKSTRTIYKNTALRGYQDTWTSNNNNGIFYFEGGYLRGRTDYMCGKGDAYFNGVELRQIAGGYAAVPSTPKSIGWVYKDCVINGEASVINASTQETATAESANGNYTLGRPWGSGTPIALFIDTKMNITPSAIGWNEMSGGWPARFAEYNSLTSTGNTIDLSSRKTIFAETHENNPVLTAEEAAYYADMSNMFGEWEPTLLTEQAPVVQNVAVSGNTLTWDDNDYALLYAVVKDGAVIDFTTDNSYELTEEGVYSVRAANEMGGLNEASESVTYAAPLILTTSQNMAGYRTFYDAENSYVADNSTIVYVAQLKRETEVVLSRLTDNVVPANTPVILKTTGLKDNGTAEAYYQITLTPSDETANYLGVNLLAVTTEGQDLSAGAYRLGWDAEDGVAFRLWNPSSASAGIVYLNVSSSLGAKFSIIFDEEEEVDPTAVNAVTEAGETMADGAAYNAAGQRVGKTYKGLVIRNGKKYNNK